MNNNAAPSAETKVSPRAMEAAMIARLIKELMQQSESSIVSSIGWRQDTGEIALERPRAHPSFSEPQAAVVRLGQYIDRLLYGERFVPDKNPLIRFSSASGQVCDISLESFSQSALGDDGVLVLPFGQSEGAPGSRSALELRGVGRFALYSAPSVLLRRQQALLPMREIIDARRRHQELLEQQTRSIEEQELLEQKNIEKMLKEGATLATAVESNLNSKGVTEERRGEKENKDRSSKVSSETKNNEKIETVDIETPDIELVKQIGSDDKQVEEQKDSNETHSIVNIKTTSEESQTSNSKKNKKGEKELSRENKEKLSKDEERISSKVEQSIEDEQEVNSILNELEFAFSEGLKNKSNDESEIVVDEGIKALVKMKEQLDLDILKRQSEIVEKNAAPASKEINERNSESPENKAKEIELDAQKNIVDLSDNKDVVKVEENNEKSSDLITEDLDKTKTTKTTIAESEVLTEKVEPLAAESSLAESMAVEATSVEQVQVKTTVVDISVSEKSNTENKVDSSIESIEESSGALNESVQKEAPSAFADSERRDSLVIALPKESPVVAQIPAALPLAPAVGGLVSIPAANQNANITGWHQIVFNIDLENLSGFLTIVDDWMDYELKLQIKEQKCALELIIPKGELALVSPIISKFKVGPITLKPKKR